METKYTAGQLVQFKDDKTKAVVIQSFKNGNVKVLYEHSFFGERKAIFPASQLEGRKFT